MLKFMADGALLSLSGEKRVAVIARNVPGMELEVARVLPDQLQHLVAFNRGSYAKPQLYSLSPDQITERFVQKIPFGETDPGKAHFEGAELGKYFSNGANARHGVFLLKLAELKPEAKKAEIDPNAEEPDNSDDSGIANEGEMEGDGQAAPDGTIVGDSRLIVVTDLGMITKRSLDGSQDVYVQSIKGGVPVDGANVDVVGKNGQTLVTRATDAAGHVHFDPLDGMTREKTPAMFVVRKGDDLSFLPIGEHDRALDFSRFDIGGERNAKNAGRLTAYLFSDRGIYRPGDTFHVGVVVRAADWTQAAGRHSPGRHDHRCARFGRRAAQAASRHGGLLAVDHTTQESAPTGSWNVNIYIVKDGKADVQIGSTSRADQGIPARSHEGRCEALAERARRLGQARKSQGAVHAAEPVRNARTGSPRRGDAHAVAVGAEFPRLCRLPLLRSAARERGLHRRARRAQDERKGRGRIPARPHEIRRRDLSAALFRERLRGRRRPQRRGRDARSSFPRSIT